MTMSCLIVFIYLKRRISIFSILACELFSGELIAQRPSSVNFFL